MKHLVYRLSRALLCAGVASMQLALAAAVDAAPSPAVDAADSAVYRLAVGDQIEIKLFYHPELNETQAIRPDGRITMQLIGELRVAGLSTTEVEALLRQRYDGILRSPLPSVFVRKYVPQRVYVGGYVNAPSVVPVEGPITLMQAIFSVGGFKFNARTRDVIIFRNNGLPDSQVLSVDIADELDGPKCTPAPQCSVDPTTGQHRSADITLLPNDIVYVPQTTVGQLAQYMDENIGKIIPLFKNMGVNLYYQLNKNLKTTTTVVPP